MMRLASNFLYLLLITGVFSCQKKNSSGASEEATSPNSASYGAQPILAPTPTVGPTVAPMATSEGTPSEAPNSSGAKEGVPPQVTASAQVVNPLLTIPGVSEEKPRYCTLKLKKDYTLIVKELSQPSLTLKAGNEYYLTQLPYSVGERVYPARIAVETEKGVFEGKIEISAIENQSFGGACAKVDMEEVMRISSSKYQSDLEKYIENSADAIVFSDIKVFLDMNMYKEAKCSPLKKGFLISQPRVGKEAFIGERYPLYQTEGLEGPEIVASCGVTKVYKIVEKAPFFSIFNLYNLDPAKVPKR